MELQVNPMALGQAAALRRRYVTPLGVCVECGCGGVLGTETLSVSGKGHQVQWLKRSCVS